MKKIIIAVCIIVLLLNAGFFTYFNVYKGDELKKVDEIPDQDVIDDVITVDPEEFRVTVPEIKVNDKLKYEYSIFAELYSEQTDENGTTYDRYTLNANGELLLNCPPVTTAEDGFKQSHDAVQLQQVTTATFSLTIDSSDSDALTVHGTTTISRSDYRDLDNKKNIKSVTNGDVYIDRLPRAPVPVSYTGKLRSYPDPNTILQDTLDESIFFKGQELGINESGQYLEQNVDMPWMSQTYNWTTDSVDRVSGYNAMRVNITSTYFNFLDFNRLIWLTNEVPQPVRAWVKTNTSWNYVEELDENDTDDFQDTSKGHMVLITDRTLLNQSENGYAPGENEVPWRNVEGSYNEKLPSGEFTAWEHLPQDGKSFDDTKLYMSSGTAVEYAKENSPELQEFMDKYGENSIVCNNARYNFTKDTKQKADPEGKAGTYYWNLTFATEPGGFGGWGRRENRSYNIVVEEKITKNLISGYGSELRIVDTWSAGPRRGSAPYPKYEFDNELLTLSSAVNLMKQDEEVKEKGFNARGGIDDDFRLALQMADIEIDTRPGLNIINTLTGITPPTAKYAWYIQQDTVFQSGNTFTCAVDVQTGQMLFVMDVEGTTLNTLFD